MRGRIPVAAAVALCMLGTPAGAHGFHDNDYHEVVLFAWDTAQLDVLIVPPASTHAAWRIGAVEQSIDAWESGIQALAPSWLAGGIVIEHHTLGLDVVPPSALLDPEIVVTSTEPGGIGLGLGTDFLFCQPDAAAGIGRGTDPAFQAHRHPGSDWVVVPKSCGGIGNVCFVINTNWETYQNGLYDLNAHEFGHCLGIGHVGDAGDFHSLRFPNTDIMSYQHRPGQVNCVSSLNVLALQYSFAGVLGGPVPPFERPAFDPAFPYVRMARTAYTQVACANPAPAPIPDPDWFPLD